MPQAASISRLARREPEPGRIRFAPSRECPGPEVVEHRVGDGISHHSARPIGEGREEVLVLNPKVLVWSFAPPAIEIDRGRAHEAALNFGNPDRCRLGEVVVDDQVERGPAVLGGNSCRCEVLDPDAGMEELGLMPGHDKRANRLVRCITADLRLAQPMSLEVARRQTEHLTAHLPAQV